jgi:hypothetical protein
MADDPENATLRLLEEMRAEMRDRFDRIDERLDGIAADIGVIRAGVAEIRRLQAP